MSKLVRNVPIVNSLRFNFPRPYRQLLALRRTQHASGKEHVRSQIQRLLSDGPAISVRRVCRRVGLSLSCLYRVYPDLCRAIAEKGRRHWNAIVLARACRLRKAIFSAVIELDRKGLYPTHSRVRPFLDSDLQKQWVESGQLCEKQSSTSAFRHASWLTKSRPDLRRPARP